MSLELDEIELGRLAILQAEPWRFIERRVETLDLKDDRHYAVSVSMQLSCPAHRPNESIGARNLLIPLGQFSKARRPDLEAFGPDGRALPVLHHDARGRATAILFTTSWQRAFYSDKGARHAKVKEVAALWDILQYRVEQVSKLPRDDAYVAIDDLETLLEEIHDDAQTELAEKAFIELVATTGAFWVELKTLAETTLRIGELHGEPRETFVITVTYTERFRYGTVARRPIRYALSWLGLDCVPISRGAANLGQCRSLWIVHSVPVGLEPLRFFWEDEGDRPEADEASSVQAEIGIIESDRAVVGRRTDGPVSPQTEPGVLLDVQIAPSASLAAAAMLAFVLGLVSVYVYQRIPSTPERTLLVDLATALAGLPATLAGVLAYRGETFIRRASRGPRVLLTFLAFLASVLAIVLGLKSGQSHKLLETTSYVLAVYSLSVFGVFAYLLAGPRWRKNDRTRWRSKTDGVSPNRCRDKQMWSALAFCAFWAIVVVVFARVTSVLQHESVFSSCFPGNVWHAWTSWFGKSPADPHFLHCPNPRRLVR